MKKGYLVIAFFALLSCTNFYQEHVTPVTVTEFNAKVAADAQPQIVDVRTPKEFNAGAIPGAVNINLNGDDFKKKIAALDKSKPIYLYCRTGIRSKEASVLVAELGFKTIYDLKGGYTGWVVHSKSDK